VHSNNSSRARLGWTFSYICCIFVHPDCDLALLFQGWTLNFKNTRHSGEWPSKCTRLDQFSLAQKLTPLPLPPLHSNHFSHLLFVRLITGSFGGFFLLFLFDYLETPEIHFRVFLFCMRSVYWRTRNDQKAGKVRKTICLKRRQARSWLKIISSMKNSI